MSEQLIRETLEKVTALNVVCKELQGKRDSLDTQITHKYRDINTLNEALKDTVALYKQNTKFINNVAEELTITYSELHWNKNSTYVIKYGLKGREGSTSVSEDELVSLIKKKEWKVATKGDFKLGKSITIKKIGKADSSCYGLTTNNKMILFDDVYGNFDMKITEGTFRLIKNKYRDSWRLVRIKSKEELEQEQQSRNYGRCKKSINICWRVTIKKFCLTEEDQIEYLL
jgi:hypothetical protein